MAANDIVGVNLQNTTAAGLSPHVFTFGQIFKNGQVKSTDTLVARIGAAAYQVQMDVLATWPDGSVKLAAITLTTPEMCAGSTLPILLSKATSSDPAFGTAPVSLADTPLRLNVAITFTGGQYSGTQTVDLGAALKQSLASTPSYWLSGPLATQARVDVPLTGGPLHLTADVTAYPDGSVTADVQFNNDLTSVIAGHPYANPAPLPPQVYTATVTLGSQSQGYTVTQYQYQDWHVMLNTVGAPLLNVSSSASPAMNVQHDLAYLEHSGAVLSYDRTTGVYNSTVVNSFVNVEQAAGFGTPLAANGITRYMPQTGGRPDIGYTTMWSTVWLMTGDSRAAMLALAQGDTGGAVPWNIKLTNGHWLTPADYPAIWIDQRSNTSVTANLPPTATDTGWTPETAHQPDLAYVPYIMTGQRWYLDRLNAQAAYSLSSDWPGYRCPTTQSGSNCAGPADIVLNGQDQIREQGWNIREIEEASFSGQPGSFEQSYFAQVASDNWNYINGQETGGGFLSVATEGQAAGWLPSGLNVPNTQTSPWMEDYTTGVAILAAEMGDAGAVQYVNWQKDTWLAGRFIAAGMNPYDGVAYRLITTDVVGRNLTTWPAIEAATVAQGFSNGTGWATAVAGDYAALGRAVLGGALTLFPNDAELQQALTWMNSPGSPNTTQNYFQQDPTFNVVPLQ
ncbi:MAG: hypothetical protein EPO08_02395 [Rhodospirillaceae bacterium]|nr:MAG: hypothetical protein EPO08_02395 [Rhodospirillaceae bacterium]